MSKSKKKHKKNRLSIAEPGFINLAPSSTTIKVEIAAVEDEQSVHIKMSGFEDFDEVVGYSNFLAEYLPLLLYQSEVVH